MAPRRKSKRSKRSKSRPRSRSRPRTRTRKGRHKMTRNNRDVNVCVQNL